MVEHEATHNQFPRIRARILYLEQDMHAWELVVANIADKSGTIDFGAIKRAEMLLASEGEELHEIRTLLSLWEEKHSPHAKIPIPFHVSVIVVSVYGLLLLLVVIYLLAGVGHG